jgi:hypothetical protein
MVALSLAKDGNLPFVVVANSIFVLSRPEDWEAGGSIIFEVRESDSEGFGSLVGVPSHYALGDQPFSGVLEILELCESTHSGLELLRHKPTLRGSITVLPETADQN